MLKSMGRGFISHMQYCTLFTFSFWLQMQKTLLSEPTRSVFFLFLLVNLQLLVSYWQN